MRIDAFHIDGFGIYRDQGVNGLPDGLVLFTGENESGKTTLLKFFRYVLFGPERKSSDPNDYQPLAGGPPGGRLILLRRDGHRFLVERRGKKAAISDDGGPALPAEPAAAILGGVDRDTFKAIFAVGLEDLQGLGVLRQGGVSARLFAAGAGAGAAAAPLALKLLNDELAELLQQRGKGRLNQIFGQLREIDRELKALAGQAARFAETQERRESVQARLAEQKAEARQLDNRLARLKQLARAREPWVNLQAAREHLARLAGVADFPAHGLEIREQLDKERAALQAELAEQRDTAAALARELAALQPDSRLLAQRSAIENLLGDEKRLEAALGQEPEERQAVRQAEADFQRRLQDLGADWDEARLARVDTSLAVRHEVQDFGRRLAQTGRRLEELRARERTLAEAAQSARRLAEEAAARLAAIPPPPGEGPAHWQREQAALRQMGALLAEQQVLATRLEARRQALEEADSRLAALERRLAPRPEPLRWWWGIPLALLALAGGAGLFFSGRQEPGLWLAGSLLAATAGFYLLRWRLNCLEHRRRLDLEEEREAAGRQRTGVAEEITALEQETAALADRLAALAQPAGQPPPASLLAVEERQAAAERALEQWRHWQAVVQERDQAEARLEEGLARVNEARQETARAAAELEELTGSWQRWLAARHFSPTLRPESFEAVLQLVEGARTAASQASLARERLARTAAYLQEMRQRIGRVLELCGRTLPEDADARTELAALRRDLNQALEEERRHGELSQRLAGLREAQSRTEKQLAAKDEERARLLTRAGAQDDADFERRAADHLQWQSWRQKLEESDLTLSTIAGTPQAREGLEAELAASDPLALEQEEAALAARREELVAAISQGEQEVGRLDTLLEQMATDRQLGDRLQERANLEEEKSRQVRRWLTLAITCHLIEAARRVYERERQPQVMQEADRFLQAMAHGRYRLFAQVGDGGVRLEDRDARQKEEVQWSAGLADQVYLAVRLGLAREFGRHAEPLPIILDDVLVKFDPRRRRGAARVILACAREQQVLLFSSHPEVAGIFRELSREAEFQGVATAFLELQAGSIHWSPA